MASEPEIICSYCGGGFPPGRLSCPHCGSDRETGWRSPEEIESEALDLPETTLEDEAYEDLLAREGLDSERRSASRGLGPIALAIALALLFLALRQCWK